MPDKPILTRDALLNGEIERLVHDDQTDLERMTDEQRATLIEQTLKSLGDSELWVFGYGSLIWNPALDYEEQRRCSIKGFEKKFCFWTTLSRGSIECPGLMMGLIEGDGCNGVAFRIDAINAATELDVLFRREMSHYIYKPTWIEAQCVETKSTFKILTFVVDIENHRFVDNLSLKDIVRIIATAQGPLGRNCDYLFQLSEKMHELGFEEPELDDLVKRVKEFQEN
ncbi:gamma-glutamylcyclotransferase [Granulosicoccus sp.]|nr:gamma-glutamylcyclotransferase [Granulosicoccus sp.]MDB4222995.1 gamma-glutamylcyclotransferase [Granulosicoccus sp.]